jgi:uncharacterized membrane protein
MEWLAHKHKLLAPSSNSACSLKQDEGDKTGRPAKNKRVSVKLAVHQIDSVIITAQLKLTKHSCTDAISTQTETEERLM